MKHFFFLVKSCLIKVFGLSICNHFLKQESKWLSITDFHMFSYSLIFTHRDVPKELIRPCLALHLDQACLSFLDTHSSKLFCNASSFRVTTSPVFYQLFHILIHSKFSQLLIGIFPPIILLFLFLFTMEIRDKLLSSLQHFHISEYCLHSPPLFMIKYIFQSFNAGHILYDSDHSHSFSLSLSVAFI